MRSDPQIQWKRWRWLVAGIVADAAVIFVPTHNWEGQPLCTALTLLFFPYGMLWSDWAPFYHNISLRAYDGPSRFFFFFAPLPFYGLLLALTARKRYFYICASILFGIHAAVTGIAALEYYR